MIANHTSRKMTPQYNREQTLLLEDKIKLELEVEMADSIDCNNDSTSSDVHQSYHSFLPPSDIKDEIPEDEDEEVDKFNVQQSYHSLPPLDIKDEIPDVGEHDEDKDKVELGVCAESPDGRDNFSDESETQSDLLSTTQPDCSNEFSSKLAFKCHRADAYECHYCQKKVFSLMILRSHLKSHMESSVTSSQPRCGTKHKEISVGGINAHRNSHQALEERRKIFQCQKCFKGFARLYLLRIHLKNHETGKHVTSNECGKFFYNVSDLKIHQKNHNTEATFATFICELCPKAFRLYNSLRSHKKLVHGLKKPAFICRICSKQFNTPSNLSKHRKRVHTVYIDNEFVCNLCEFKCKTSKLLKVHIERLHTGEEHHEIGKNETFNNIDDLWKHQKNHNTETTFICELCPKTYRLFHSFQSHKKLVHGLKKSELICRICNKQFNTPVRMILTDS